MSEALHDPPDEAMITEGYVVRPPLLPPLPGPMGFVPPPSKPTPTEKYQQTARERDRSKLIGIRIAAVKTAAQIFQGAGDTDEYTKGRIFDLAREFEEWILRD